MVFNNTKSARAHATTGAPVDGMREHHPDLTSLKRTTWGKSVLVPVGSHQGVPGTEGRDYFRPMVRRESPTGGEVK